MAKSMALREFNPFSQSSQLRLPLLDDSVDTVDENVDHHEAVNNVAARALNNQPVVEK